MAACKSIKTTLCFVLKMLIGAMFCCSAVLKILAIDKFEIYIFSFGFFSLNFSFIVARLCIALEFILGISLIINVYNKWVIRLTYLVLGAFTVFLIYVILIGRTDNCHCFGDLVEFSPVASIFKNVILLVTTFFASKVEPYNFRLHWIFVILLMIIPTVTVFCVSPPDNFLFSDEGENGIVSQKLFSDYIADNDDFASTGVANGKKMVCFFSVSCRYCQLTAQKISAISERWDIPDTNILYIFRGKYRETQANKFFKKTNSKAMPYTFISSDYCHPMTHGIVPVVIFVENGTIKQTFDYRSISEKSVAEFFLN